MSQGLASLISVLGAGMGGYARGTQIARDNERQDARDAQQQEEYQYQKGLRDKATQLATDVAASQRDITPDITTSTGATYTDPDLMAADNRENRRNFEATGQAAPAPMTANPVTPEQQQAMLGVNSRASKMTRLADVYSKHGDADNAMKYEAFAKQAIAEGADKTLTSISASAPSVDAVKKAGGTVVGTVGKDTADIFNKTGSQWKVSADTPVQHFIDTDSTGREFVNSRIMGKDGKEVIGDVQGLGKMLMTQKERMAQDNSDASAYQTSQQIKESGRHNKAEEGIQRTSAATSAAHLGIAQQSLELQQDAALAATPAGQIAALEKANGGPLTADQKMAKLGLSKISQTDQMQVASLLKTQEQLDQAKAKAMADGSWNPDSAGAKEMTTQHVTISMKLNKVLDKYNGGKASNADPLNIMGGGPAPAAVKAPAAARGVAPGLGAIPSAPQQYIAGVKGENPDYTAWQQKYGSAIANAQQRYVNTAFQNMHD
jgi:hypothetical protein